MPMIETQDGVRLYAKIWGTGRPVVLIHGWPLSSDSWDPQSHALADAGYRVIAYDRRGFGRSDQPDGGYDYDHFADDLAAVMAATGATSDVALVGFSMGGGEVVRYLYRHGGRGITRAALVSSVVPFMLRTADNPNGVPEEAFATMTAGMKADRPAFFRSFFKDFFGQEMTTHAVSGETLDWAWQMAMQSGLRPTLGAAKAFATTDFRADLAAVTCPLLVIHGTADKTVPIDATGRVVAATVKGATLLEYADAPHGLFVTHGDRLTTDLLTFLARG